MAKWYGAMDKASSARSDEKMWPGLRTHTHERAGEEEFDGAFSLRRGGHTCRVECARGSKLKVVGKILDSKSNSADDVQEDCRLFARVCVRCEGT